MATTWTAWKYPALLPAAKHCYDPSRMVSTHRRRLEVALGWHSDAGPPRRGVIRADGRGRHVEPPLLGMRAVGPVHPGGVGVELLLPPAPPPGRILRGGHSYAAVTNVGRRDVTTLVKHE